jgi:hypothetical protein
VRRSWWFLWKVAICEEDVMELKVVWSEDRERVWERYRHVNMCSLADIAISNSQSVLMPYSPWWRCLRGPGLNRLCPSKLCTTQVNRKVLARSNCELQNLMHSLSAPNTSKNNAEWIALWTAHNLLCFRNDICSIIQSLSFRLSWQELTA